jgi:hypothetical protein
MVHDRRAVICQGDYFSHFSLWLVAAYSSIEVSLFFSKQMSRVARPFYPLSLASISY